MLPKETLIAITLSVASTMAFAQQGPTMEIAGRQVEVKVVKAETSEPVQSAQGNFRLATELTRVPQRSNVLLELRTRGIKPDAEAGTLVYDLNPQITNLNAVGSEQNVYLPVLMPRREGQQLIKTGYLVELTVDPEIRTELNNQIENLQRLAPSISALKFDTETEKQIARTIEWFGEVKIRFKRRTGPP